MLSPPHPKIPSLNAGLNEDKKKTKVRKRGPKAKSIATSSYFKFTPKSHYFKWVSDKKCPYLSLELFRVM